VIEWEEEKNNELLKHRGLSFEQAEAEISAGRVLSILPNPRYPGQIIFEVS
jgi:uncharacterized DUF497 family protein